MLFACTTTAQQPFFEELFTSMNDTHIFTPQFDILTITTLPLWAKTYLAQLQLRRKFYANNAKIALESRWQICRQHNKENSQWPTTSGITMRQIWIIAVCLSEIMIQTYKCLQLMDLQPNNWELQVIW